MAHVLNDVFVCVNMSSIAMAHLMKLGVVKMFEYLFVALVQKGRYHRIFVYVT